VPLTCACSLFLEKTNKTELRYVEVVDFIKERDLKDASANVVLALLNQKCMFLILALTIRKENTNKLT
jgi:hypothetical protein